MAFLQASAGVVELEIGEAGLIDARGHGGGRLSAWCGVGSSSHHIELTRALTATATAAPSGSTDLVIITATGASSGGTVQSTTVDWPFYWAAMTSSGSSTAAKGYVALI